MKLRGSGTPFSTQESPYVPPTNPQGFIGFQRLERQRWAKGKYNVWNGRNKVIEIEILKSLDGRDQVDTFSNRYLFTGDDDTTTDDAEETARNCAALESEIYPENVSFVRAVIRHLDAFSSVVLNETRSFPLDFVGQYEVADGDSIAPAHVVAVYEKAAILGRPGLTSYRHCVTSSEFEAWSNDRTRPARFFQTDYTIGVFTNPFEEMILTALGMGDLVPCLPDLDKAGLDQPRPITVVRFGGIRLNDPSRPKKSAGVNMMNSAQQKINELAALARRALRSDPDGVGSDNIESIVVELKAKASKIFWDLEVELRIRIKWPTVFGAAPAANVPD